LKDQLIIERDFLHSRMSSQDPWGRAWQRETLWGHEPRSTPQI